ncbi:MAG TPA: NAD(P)-binding domain-containing protein, partial [Candidatus Krumholzibacteria bacterium]|nr:NAD(P)-binding domain-containing protein [Candidatus Krumholzibacteria bacterium]
MNPIRRYLHWLHGQWPAGAVERLPECNQDGSTRIPGLYIVGDLRGVPLLKFAADSGARAIHAIRAMRGFVAANGEAGADVVDVAILGGGVSGAAAAMEATKHGLTFRWFEASEPFSTIVNFPRRKPIFTYPKSMTPAGELRVSADVKEALVEELVAQARRAGVTPETAHVARVERRGDGFDVALSDARTIRARHVVCALGKSGDFRRLNVPGERLDKVTNRLHDPADFAGRRVLVVGGGDSALETAVALTDAGARVTLSYRGDTFARPKHENVEALARAQNAGRLRVLMSSTVKEIRPDAVDIATGDGRVEPLPNDDVFVMIGREAPLGFFRRSGIHLHGERSRRTWVAFASFVAFCVALYNWKSGGALGNLFYQRHWWPVSIADAARALAPGSLGSVLLTSASSPSFWYTLAYSALVTVFGVRRIRRRRTPYITLQTSVLMAIQVLPLFILPEILLPYLGANGLLPAGVLDALFPVVDYGHGREYWRAYGFVLAWPLNVYNVFTNQPLGWWLAIAFVQTCVLIPVLIYFWGKGAYCGWICSCGALAETLGDRHRHKMPHGPFWNRFNMVGQVFLAFAFALLIFRAIGWIWPGSFAGRWYDYLLTKAPVINYVWFVDLLWAGILGVGLYFWFSGHVWCRFACPLAALMHIYTRFSRFRILADKKKCISCNVCTSVCHQGIDVMQFANRGAPMEDPECVRCSACVQSCPTGVLSFGQVDRSGRVVSRDTLPASPVRMRE